MAFFNEFPHTRTYDSDLGWLIRHVGENITNLAALQNWAATHKEEYDDLKDKVDGLIDNLVDVIVPWDSSNAYHIFSIVEYQGTNYIAVQDVPIGAMITNTDYWQPANTVVEQVNAIGQTVDDLKEEKVSYTDIHFGVQRPAMLCEMAVRGNVKIRDFAGSENFDNGFISMQGACYIPSIDRIALSIIKGSTGEAILTMTDTDFNVIRRVGPLPIGHVNDMTYNPNTETIFLTTGYDGNYAQHIVEVDQNLTIVNTYNIGVSNWIISYDAEENKFYVIADEGFYRYNADFTVVEQLPYDLNYVGDGTIHIQGSEFINGILYVMTFTEYTEVAGYTGANIIGFDREGNVVSSMHYALTDPSDEPESIYVKDDKIYILAGQSWFRVYVMAYDYKTTMENFMSDNHSSKTLENGTDLDDVMIPGRYQTLNSAGTATIVNEPSGGYSSISLKVEIVQWYSIKQTVTATFGNTWVREYDTPTDTWGAWRKEATRTNMESDTIQTEVASASSTVVYTVAVPAKKMAIIDVTVSFPSNATGRRMLSIDGVWKESANAVSGDATRLSATCFIENRSNASRNISVRVYQNSGGALTVDSEVRYIFM